MVMMAKMEPKDPLDHQEALDLEVPQADQEQLA